MSEKNELIKVDKEDTCSCCKYNPRCNKEDCDFKDLKYEKEEILLRLKKEKEHVDSLKEKVGDLNSKGFDEDSVKNLMTILDIAKGMQIMIDRLCIDFGMTEKEIKDIVDLNKKNENEKMSYIQRAKVALKMRKLLNARSKKK